MNFSTEEAKQAYKRIDTVHWVVHMAMMAMARYRSVLSDQEVFSQLFPNTNFVNPKITHEIGEHGVLFLTTKSEIMREENYNLYKAW